MKEIRGERNTKDKRVEITLGNWEEQGYSRVGKNEGRTGGTREGYENVCYNVEVKEGGCLSKEGKYGDVTWLKVMYGSIAMLGKM